LSTKLEHHTATMFRLALSVKLPDYLVHHPGSILGRDKNVLCCHTFQTICRASSLLPNGCLEQWRC
jgi:hypothetical protein